MKLLGVIGISAIITANFEQIPSLYLKFFALILVGTAYALHV